MYDCDREDYFRDTYDIKDEEFHVPQNSHKEGIYNVLNKDAGMINISWLYIIMEYIKPKFTVYMHVNKINGKRYIGITRQNPPEKRWKNNGLGYINHGTHSNIYKLFYADIQKYGWDNFEHIIVDTELTEFEAKSIETQLIKYYNTTNNEFGYNTRIIDNNIRCYTDPKHKENLKLYYEKYPEKLSRLKLMRSGKNNPFYGKKHSIKTKEKMSKNHADVSGEKHPFYGKKHTEKSKKLMSEHLKGREIWNRGKSGYKIKPSSDIKKQRISVANKGRVYVSNGEIIKFVHPDKIPEGFIRTNSSRDKSIENIKT
jgi:group I intron endonuclease